MMPRTHLIAVGLLAVGATALAGASASSKPLYREECAKLKIERIKLLTKDMQAALARGPDWVKDHLNKDKIEHVRHFLQVEENLAFRCRGGGIAKVKPPAMPLPDRKPDAPVMASAEDEAGQTIGLPLRKPELPSSAASEVKASQTLADSDKTAPAGARATQ